MLDEKLIEVYIKERMVGYIDGDTYFTRRSAKLHFFRRSQGYPISVSVLKTLKQHKTKWVVVIEYDRDDEKEVFYRCYVSDYESLISFQEEGFDEQKCMPLRRMEKLKDGYKNIWMVDLD